MLTIYTLCASDSAPENYSMGPYFPEHRTPRYSENCSSCTQFVLMPSLASDVTHKLNHVKLVLSLKHGGKCQLACSNHYLYHRDHGHLSIDFVTDLPYFSGFITVLIIIDCVSKSCRLIPMKIYPWSLKLLTLCFIKFSECMAYQRALIGHLHCLTGF